MRVFVINFLVTVNREPEFKMLETVLNQDNYPSKRQIKDVFSFEHNRDYNKNLLNFCIMEMSEEDYASYKIEN
jgi:hypothetical protein